MTKWYKKAQKTLKLCSYIFPDEDKNEFRNNEILKDCICPITKGILKFPAMLGNSQTLCEKGALKIWLRNNPAYPLMLMEKDELLDEGQIYLCESAQNTIFEKIIEVQRDLEKRKRMRKRKLANINSE